MSAASRAPRRLFTLAIALVAALAPSAPGALAAESTATYVVQLAEPPLASYRGGTEGIPATSPDVTGQPLRPDSTAAQRYRSHLAGQQEAAVDRLDGDAPTVLYSYRTAFAGFAARLTSEEARELRASPEVARVWRDERRQLTQTEPGADVAAALGGVNGDPAAYL